MNLNRYLYTFITPLLHVDALLLIGLAPLQLPSSNTLIETTLDNQLNQLWGPIAKQTCAEQLILAKAGD